MGLITYLTTIRFDSGAIAGLGQDLIDLKIERPMIVADRGVVAVGLVERLQEAAPALAGATVFDDVPSNPTEEAAETAVAIFKARDCDGLVAIGGGSPIDLAKAVALRATHAEPLAAYAAILGGMPKITAAVAPVIAVPTTAGTGSEVGRAALVTLADGRKLGFISPHLIPRRAICDPELTVGLPPLLTAATGMDALTHCIETYLSPRDNPPAEAIALDGAGRVASHLVRAVENGTDRSARREMMMAALEGGLSFQKGLGAVHSLSHALGGLKSPSLHHGTLNAVLLPAVLRFNAEAAPDKYAALRRALGLAEGADLARYVEDLNASIGMPRSLKAMGAPRETFDTMAKAALADHSTATNPRPVSESEFRGLLDAAWD
jgi:4-hydroxybutyrate dehydrogenase